MSYEDQLIREATGQGRDFDEAPPAQGSETTEPRREDIVPHETISSNARTWNAIAAVRIERNPATMSELYHALNARNYTRNAKLTRDERDALSLEYLKRNAPDLITAINQPVGP